MNGITIMAFILTAWLSVFCSATEAAPQGAAAGTPGTTLVETQPGGGNDTRSDSPETAGSVQESGGAEGAQQPGIKYESESQRARCEPYRQNLKDRFLRARYFSIQGDPCATAEHAQAFLNLVAACLKECPADFVKKAGFSDRTLRNVKLLHKHGSERCLK